MLYKLLKDLDYYHLALVKKNSNVVHTTKIFFKEFIILHRLPKTIVFNHDIKLFNMQSFLY
jgi:hypothetical protein